MNYLTFDEILPLDKNRLQTGCFLWVIAAEAIPPHIGISFDGVYFSVKVGGKDVLEAQKMFQKIQRKKIPSLFVELDSITFSASKWQEMLSNYSEINSVTPTCLIPILDLFDLKEASFLLPDFLDELSKNHQIAAVYGFQIREDFHGIARYSTADVSMHIETLAAKKKKR